MGGLVLISYRESHALPSEQWAAYLLSGSSQSPFAFSRFSVLVAILESTLLRVIITDRRGRKSCVLRLRTVTMLWLALLNNHNDHDCVNPDPTCHNSISNTSHEAHAYLLVHRPTLQPTLLALALKSLLGREPGVAVKQDTLSARAVASLRNLMYATLN